MIGLVGANGAGKSTLLTTVAGVGNADIEGTVTLSPPDATVGYLAQEPDRIEGETVLEFLGRRTGVTAAETAMNAAAESLADGGEDLYSPALDKWLALGGADLAERAEKVLADLGLDVTGDAHMTDLSGTGRTGAGLASLLLSRYDVLLLDEPTNDLDLPGLEQLEQFVAETRTALGWSVTIGSSWRAPSPASSNSISRSSRSRCTTRVRVVPRRTRGGPGGTRARPTTSTQGTCRHSRTAHRCT